MNAVVALALFQAVFSGVRINVVYAPNTIYPLPAPAECSTLVQSTWTAMGVPFDLYEKPASFHSSNGMCLSSAYPWSDIVENAE